MRWAPDDIDSMIGGEIDDYDYPSVVEMLGAMNDPFIAQEIDRLIDEAEMMGLDIDDPEMMGGPLINLVKKIKSAVQKRREKKKGGGVTTMPTVSIQTGQGTAQLGPDGLSWTSPQSAGTVRTVAAMSPTATEEGSIMKMLKNPLVLGGGLAAILLLMMMMKKRG